jgi:hypothetical protein
MSHNKNFQNYIPKALSWLEMNNSVQDFTITILMVHLLVIIMRRIPKTLKIMDYPIGRI